LPIEHQQSAAFFRLSALVARRFISEADLSLIPINDAKPSSVTSASWGIASKRWVLRRVTNDWSFAARYPYSRRCRSRAVCRPIPHKFGDKQSNEDGAYQAVQACRIVARGLENRSPRPLKRLQNTLAFNMIKAAVSLRMKCKVSLLRPQPCPLTVTMFMRATRVTAVSKRGRGPTG
jgi:hypothetical protein